jgi:Tol biopolymer transport system component
MLKLHGDGNNHYLPVWSGDGARLAFQRSDVKQRISKILLFSALSQPKPSVLDDAIPSNDSMFRWGKSSPAGYAFARIDAESGAVKVWISTDGGEPVIRSQGSQRNRMPDLYERTDGIWLMASEKDGKVVVEAFSGDEAVDDPKDLGPGTSPRWSGDGGSLLLQRARKGKVGAFDIVLQSRKTDDATQLSTSDVVRSPAWSPDEQYAAWFAKDAGDTKPWRIEVAALSGQSKPRKLASDVVVNLLFESDEPTWEPTSRRIWCFSHQQRQQAYYPLVAIDVSSGQEQVVDYPQRCTNPSDLAINPRTEVPELTFVGHDGTPQDLYVLFLNHY